VVTACLACSCSGSLSSTEKIKKDWTHRMDFHRVLQSEIHLSWSVRNQVS
jgi:hypothetical protein